MGVRVRGRVRVSAESVGTRPAVGLELEGSRYS